MNSDFERDLQRALRRVEPPDGFAERVMLAVPNAVRTSRRHWRGRYWFGALAAGLALVATLASIEQQQRRERQVRAEQAQRQVIFALSLASEKLNRAMSQANFRLQRSAPEVVIGGDERGRL